MTVLGSSHRSFRSFLIGDILYISFCHLLYEFTPSDNDELKPIQKKLPSICYNRYISQIYAVSSIKSIDCLAFDGATEELINDFKKAASYITDQYSNDEQESKARSAAEQFLFNRLETLPETHGMFELNAKLDFKFGSKWAETDLVLHDFRANEKNIAFNSDLRQCMSQFFSLATNVKKDITKKIVILYNGSNE